MINQNKRIYHPFNISEYGSTCQSIHTNFYHQNKFMNVFEILILQHALHNVVETQQFSKKQQATLNLRKKHSNRMIIQLHHKLKYQHNKYIKQRLLE
ncbi:unnamed protein product [Paramecium octaurelia]|uniref:Uncharacterized protein n=1 Tax=Paramecium octaurelia TaxID=43137 RepID=A0A8S1XRY8_PAROT|nr:unnamed protein product [Paramecium octaurelia]